MKKLFIYMLLTFILCFENTSCKKFVEVPSPDTSVDIVTVFDGDQTATSAMVGVYSSLMNSSNSWLNGANTIFQGLSADELINTSPSTITDDFRNNGLLNTNTTITNTFWLRAYATIFPINAIIERLSASNGVTEATKTQLMGEAKFMRALNYFYLVNLFGDVPLVTTTDYKYNSNLGRTPTSIVYQQIVDDLKDAQANLSASYVVTTSLPTARVRPNKWTATALLGRVYLYLKDWSQAEAAATSVITSGIYSMPADLATVFSSTSNEAIWQLLPVSSNNTSEGNIFVTASNSIVPTYILSPSLVSSFESSDLRKTKWTTTNTIIVGGVSTNYTYPSKYKIKTGSTYTEYNMVLRLAEMYLIRAEARANQNNLMDAIADINVIRKRAGISLLSNTLAKSQILAAIEQERRIEFFAEFGHRWLDLKRTNRSDAVLAPLKGSNWQLTDTLYPIPLSQINLNSQLTQNQGY